MADLPVRHAPPAELGPALKTARIRAGLGLREAARLAGVNHTYLYALEAGHRCPSVVVAGSLRRVLDLTGEESAFLDASAIADRGRAHPLRSPRVVS